MKLTQRLKIWGVILGMIVGAVVTSEALACVVRPGLIDWPTYQQTNVPLNANIRAYASATTVTLIETSSGALVTLEAVEVETNNFVKTYRPSEELKPNTEYTVNSKVEPAGYEDTVTFTTGTQADTEPPVIDPNGLNISFDWAFANEEVLVFNDCDSGADYDVVDLSEEMKRYYNDFDKLPAHYTVNINFSDISEQTGSTICSLDQVDDSNNVVHIADYEGCYINFGRLLPEEIGNSKTFRIQLKDVLGNTQEEALDVTFNFDEENSTYTVTTKDGTVIKSGESTGGIRPAEASSGCSLSKNSNATSGMAIFILFSFAIFTLLAIRNSKTKKINVNRFRLWGIVLGITAVGILVGCGGGAGGIAGFNPKIVPTERPVTSTNINGFVEAECTLDAYNTINCSSIKLEEKFQCNYILKPIDELNLLSPQKPIALCQTECSKNNEWCSNIEHLYGLGFLVPYVFRYIVIDDNNFKIIESVEDFKNIFAPIDTDEEAIAFVLALSRDNEGPVSIYNNNDLEKFVYDISKWKSLVPDFTGTHVEKDGEDYLVNLFKSSIGGRGIEDPSAPCGTRPTLYSVEYRVTTDGTITEGTRIPILVDMDDNDSCIIVD